MGGACGGDIVVVLRCAGWPLFFLVDFPVELPPVASGAAHGVCHIQAKGKRPAGLYRTSAREKTDPRASATMSVIVELVGISSGGVASVPVIGYAHVGRTSSAL